MQQQGDCVHLFGVVSGQDLQRLWLTETIDRADARRLDDVTSHQLSEVDGEKQAQDNERNNLTAQITRTLEQQADRTSRQQTGSIGQG